MSHEMRRLEALRYVLLCRLQRECTRFVHVTADVAA